MKKPKPKLKKPSRKFVLIEVATDLPNKVLAETLRIVAGDGVHIEVIQVHVNAAKKEKAK